VGERNEPAKKGASRKRRRSHITEGPNILEQGGVMTDSEQARNLMGSPFPAPEVEPTLSPSQTDLMERIVSSDNMEIAWKRVRANRGAAGIDGTTIDEFPALMREEWPRTSTSLLDGTYGPAPVRRKAIPKPDGGERLLGIPTVLDRLVQQAVLQVLMPIFDPGFSESSFGFRPGRSAHGAVRQVKQSVNDGYRVAVDMDLSKFFDRVQHDVLMHRVARKVHDRRVLRLIGRFLRAGIMADGVVIPSEEGTPQGGPLSPLLANILLDDLDKELEARGLRFARYADDFMILVRTKAAALRVKTSITNWLTRRLKLVVNEEKSKVAPASQCKFLGFRIAGKTVRLAEKTLKRFKDRIREITGRNRGISMAARLKELCTYLRGWINYFALAGPERLFGELDEWIRRRVRMCYWKQWKRPRTRIRKLLARGTLRKHALACGLSRKGPWRLSKTLGTHTGLTTKWLHDQGLLFIRDEWEKLAPLR
jgi:RNA-directed DNA polymerase